MPRSSGGGSHHGGSHHSSHSSHHSSGGGSHRSGTHYSNRTFVRNTTRIPFPAGGRVSHKSFAGGHRYVRYRKGRPHYIYANYDVTKEYGYGIGAEVFKTFMTIILVFFGFFYFTLIGLGPSLTKQPSRIASNYDDVIMIEDAANVIDDKAALEKDLKDFYIKTGVTPAVVTVNNSLWEEDYDELEDYSYDLYVNLFVDEYHWLVVYSEPEEKKGSFNDWYFEGMIGLDVGDLITTRVEDHFTDQLMRGFTDRQISVGDAISQAFDLAAEESLKKNNRLAGWIILVVVMTILMAALIFIRQFVLSKCRRTYDGYKLEPEEGDYVSSMTTDDPFAPSRTAPRIERVCEYCRGVYVAGTVTECPHCGASVPAASYGQNLFD